MIISYEILRKYFTYLGWKMHRELSLIKTQCIVYRILLLLLLTIILTMSFGASKIHVFLLFHRDKFICKAIQHYLEICL